VEDVMATDDFVLVAMKGDDWRAMTCIDDLSCEELAQVLLEWHATDPQRKPCAMLRSQFRDLAAGRSALTQGE
jgi:hypothetical protein